MIGPAALKDLIQVLPGTLSTITKFPAEINGIECVFLQECHGSADRCLNLAPTAPAHQQEDERCVLDKN